MRRSEWWASFRAHLGTRGLDPAGLTLVDAFDDDEGIDVGLLFTADERFIAWRRKYSDDDPSADVMLEWEDVTASWESSILWGETAEAFLRAKRNVRSL